MNVLPFLDTKDYAILQTVSKDMQSQVRHRLSRYSIVLHTVDEFHTTLKSGKAMDSEPSSEFMAAYGAVIREVRRHRAAGKTRTKEYARKQMDPKTFSIIYEL